MSDVRPHSPVQDKDFEKGPVSHVGRVNVTSIWPQIFLPRLRTNTLTNSFFPAVTGLLEARYADFCIYSRVLLCVFWLLLPDCNVAAAVQQNSLGDNKNTFNLGVTAATTQTVGSTLRPATYLKRTPYPRTSLQKQVYVYLQKELPNDPKLRESGGLAKMNKKTEEVSASHAVGHKTHIVPPQTNKTLHKLN